MKVEEVMVSLTSISNKKLQMIHEIFLLTEKQKDCLLNEDEEGLNKVIDEKQRLMEMVDGLDYDFTNNYEALKGFLNISSLDEYEGKQLEGIKTLKTLVSNIMTELQKLQSLDNEVNEIANKNMEEIKKQLKDLKNSVKATNSYNKKNMEIPSILIDKKR